MVLFFQKEGRKGSEKSRIMQEFVVFFAGYSATCIEYRPAVR